MKNLIDAIRDITRLPVVETLGWTLLHFLWQGVLIALILAALLWLLKNYHPSLRYGLSCASLALMFVCPIITYMVLDSSNSTPPVVETALPPQTEGVAEPALVNDVQVQPAVAPIVFAPEGGSGKKVSWLERNLKPWLPYLVVFWGIGVLVLSIRLLGGLWFLRKLRTRLTKPVSAAVMSQLNNVAERLGLARTVQLRESLAVTVPLVVGWIRPMILLPSSVISGLSVKQLEMILAHELAHIRRHDYLVNLLQSVIETLLFYHPAVWWVSAKIRHERELCCDDLAIQVCGGDKQSYAQALSDLDDLRPKMQLVQAASGGSLLKRILRLVDKAIPKALEPRQWLVGLGMIAASVILFMIIGINLTIAQELKPQIRLAYFIYGGPNVDWLMSGEIIENGGQKQINIPVGYVNGYFSLEPGTHSFRVVPTGATPDEALLETDVKVETGHRYTLAVMGQLEDEQRSALVIDETAELQKLGASKEQEVYFFVNNVDGANTLDLDQDGYGPKDVPYGGFGVAAVPFKYTNFVVTANGDPNAVVDRYPFGGRNAPSTDTIISYFGHFPGTLDVDYGFFNSSPSSDLNILELLEEFNGAGMEFENQTVTFNTFLQAVKIVGLTDLLTSGEPLLIYPPTDAAFAELPKDQFDVLMADPKALGDVIRNHIVEAFVPKGALAATPGGPFNRSFTNLLGETITIGDGYTINGMSISGVIDPGSIFTIDGTQFHAITKVLLPASMVEAPQPTPEETEVWEKGLPPNGTWQVELTPDDFIRMGVTPASAEDFAGVYTWTFEDGQAITSWKAANQGFELTPSSATYTLVGDVVRITFLKNRFFSGSEYDDIQWRLEDDGLHLHLVKTIFTGTQEKAYLEAKPWQKIE